MEYYPYVKAYHQYRQCTSKSRYFGCLGHKLRSYDVSSFVIVLRVILDHILFNNRSILMSLAEISNCWLSIVKSPVVIKIELLIYNLLRE